SHRQAAILSRMDQHVLAEVSDHYRGVVAVQSMVDAGVASRRVGLVLHHAVWDIRPVSPLWNVFVPGNDELRVVAHQIVGASLPLTPHLFGILTPGRMP